MNILIIGAGAYGLALSNILSEKNNVAVYSSIKEEIDNLKNTHKNEKLFPNIKLSNKIEFINKIEKKYELIVIALPTSIIEQELLKLKNNIKETSILITSKGINNGKFPYQMVKEILKTKDIYVLSGPSFAKDVIEKQSISLTLAGKNNIQNIFNEKYINIEHTKDIIGTEVCGTIKNIYAIESGIIGGMNLSESTKAAYLTKVVKETKEIVMDLKGKKETVLLSCGIGDIILTCSSISSRNYTLGYMIGKKKNIEDYIKTTTVEGLNSLTEIKKIIDLKNYKIINTIYNIIYNNENIEEILKV